MIRRYDFACPACNQQTLNHLCEPDEMPVCAKCGVVMARLWTETPATIDDTLPGGARWIENLGHDPVWVETKTQLKAELDRRGLELRDTRERTAPDATPWATPTRLRAGVEDRHYERLAAWINRNLRRLYGPGAASPDSAVPGPANLVNPERIEEPLSEAEVGLVTTADAWLRAHGLPMLLR